MPRLISDRRKPNPMPRCGRRIVYVNPHSPFQKLVESARVSRGMSVRDLAEQVSHRTPRAPRLNPGSLWIWLRNQNGFPHPKSCTDARLEALASALRVPLPRLKEALDSSRHLYTARDVFPATQAIDKLIEFYQGSNLRLVRRMNLLAIARKLRKRYAKE